MTIGAVIGMYVRGLFFDYNVVWRSTFIRDADVVSLILQCFLGPAALFLGQPLPDASEAVLLMTPAGVPAAKWIHLYAVSAALFVIIPRMAMALVASIRRQAIARKMPLDLRADYFQRLIAIGRTRQVQRLEEAIGADVRVQCAGFSDALATFVCETLYDGRIVPRLEEYREQGGAVQALEESIGRECESFQAELEQYLPVAQRDFERSLSESIERTIGTRLAVLTVPTEGITREVGTISEGSSHQVPTLLGRRLADLVSASVSAAVAVAAGTVSGGIGKTLGTAIVVGLLGTTGPVSFVIGAVGVLLVGGAGWWLGRDTLAGGLKRINLPGLVVRATLWRLGKITADGREQCRKSVKELMDRELEPLTPKIAEQIWHSVKPLVGEQHRQERMLVGGEDAESGS
jgi:hypothetical protein